MSYSERTFGARVANAKDLLTHLKSFTAYAPPSPNLSAAALEALIDNITAQNDLTTGSIEEYTQAVDDREKLFKKEPGSLMKLISPISSSAIAAFGKESKHANSVMVLARKIGGRKLKKPGKNADAQAISESERSYGSMAQALADIIVLFDMNSNTYTPSNPAITVAALQGLHARMDTAAKNVAASFGAQAGNRAQRLKNYGDLKAVAQRIKEAVKSQYTASSIEYKLVKSLTI